MSTYPSTLIVDKNTLELFRNVLGPNEADATVILPQARVSQRVAACFIIR